MTQLGSLEVKDQNGWRRVYLLDKATISLGSHENNDIVLPQDRGPGVAEFHAQLIINPGDETLYQLVNYSDQAIDFGAAAGLANAVAPRSAAPLADKNVFRLGGYTLKLHTTGQLTSRPTGEDERPALALGLNLPENTLKPGSPLTGQVWVRNLGEQAGVKFELTVESEGLTGNCYTLEPGPLLAPGDEGQLTFRLFHRGQRPPAGNCQVILRATAPVAYPGQQVEFPFVIHVDPYYEHELTVALKPRLGQS